MMKICKFPESMGIVNCTGFLYLVGSTTSPTDGLKS